MGRGPKPAKSKDAKPSVARKSPETDGARVRDLENRLAESVGQLQMRTRELAAAQEQQMAASEILRVISQSPTDVQPVFDAIAASGSRLCGGVAAIVTRFDGEMIHLVAHHNRRESVPPRNYPRRPGRDTPTARAILECSIVHVPDAEQDADLAPGLARDVRAGSFLAVPMLRDAQPIGAISVSRAETGPFPLSQIELLKTFADQAVIAIENVRLFKELQASNKNLREALNQQTATAEVLRVISQSPTDVQPVFDAIAANAARLCDAVNGLVIRFDGELLHLAAQCNVDPERLAAVRQAYPRPASRGALSGRAILTRNVVHVPDVSKDPEYARGAPAFDWPGRPVTVTGRLERAKRRLLPRRCRSMQSLVVEAGR